MGERTDWYQDITDRIIAALEAGPGEWSKPWKGLTMSGMPRNGKTGRKYNGLNVWLLALAGYSDARWYTFNQAKALKASVRKGEHGTKIFWWHFLNGWADAATGKRVENPSQADINSGKVRASRIPLLRVFTVFNAQQIDGLPGTKAPEVDPVPGFEQAAALVDRLQAPITHINGTDTACYRPGSDRIELPAPSQFEGIEHYWATALHELVHWTGHKSRLDRDLGHRFGSDAYAMEELVAELGAAFLCTRLGIEGRLRHEEYLAHWLKVLRGDKYAIFKASSLAQKASEFLLNGGETSAEEEDNGEESETPTAKAA